MTRLYYRLLLRAYPPQMRREFGSDMELAFAALDREQGGRWHRRCGVLLRETVDVLRNGVLERRGTDPGSDAIGRAEDPGDGNPRHLVPKRTRPRKRGRAAGAFLHDLRYALRALSSAPGFTLIAAATLALGIGATTLIFSVADAVLLKPLPYVSPEQLVMVGSEFGGSGRMSPLTPPDFLELRERGRSFSGIAASASATLDLTGEGTPRRFPAARVSADFFRVLGVEPTLGRSFTAAEETPGNEAVAVISHRAWQNLWAGDPDVVGRTIALNRVPHTVIGVMPPDFRPPEAISYQPRVQVWVPLAIDREQTNRFTSYLWTIARLEDDATMAVALAELDALTEAFRQEFYDGEDRFALRSEPLFDRTVGSVGDALTVLSGAVGLLLLIACANVANLSLARGRDRGREIAMRAALGAGRGRMVQQLLLESIVLAIVGGATGALLAYGGIRALPTIDPGRLPRLAEVSLDLRVLGFAMAISMLTGMVFGLGPAVRVARADLSNVLKAARHAGGGRRLTRGGRDLTRGGLLVAQTALALVLLVGAGLLINSFVRLRAVDPGFDADRLMTMRLYVPPEVPGGSRWSPSSDAEWEGWRTFYSDLLDRVEAIPGVTAVAGTTSPPIIGAEIWMAILPEGQEPGEENNYQADNRVSPGYFRTIGSTLIRGREFTRADDNGASHAIVNEAFAERYWPGEDPLGKRFQYGTEPDPEGDFMTVVGLVENTAQGALGSEVQAEFFVPFFQNPLRAMTVLARYEGDPEPLADAMRAAVWELKPELPVNIVEPMRDTMAASIVQPRFYTLLLTAFAAVAMTLAGVGVYGTMAFSVGQRTREVGVRMALGARAPDVLRMVVMQGMQVTVLGLLLGAAGAFALSRYLETLVFGIEPTDPATFVVVASLLATVAALACYIPARRAARLDPAETLRAD